VGNDARHGITSRTQYKNKGTQTESDLTANKVEALEELMKPLILANDQMSKANKRRDEILAAILSRLPTSAEPADDEKARRDVVVQQLEAEREELEAELNAKYEAAGITYTERKDNHRQAEHDHPQREQNQDGKPENVKIEQVGLFQPLAPTQSGPGKSSIILTAYFMSHLQAG
jgi:hypothetical protein